MNKILQAVMRVEQINAKEALETLAKWSQEIDTDFIATNAVAIGCRNTTGDVRDFMEATSLIMQQLTLTNKILVREVAEMKRLLKGVSTDVQVVAALTPTKATSRALTAFDTTLSKVPKPGSEGEVTQLNMNGAPVKKTPSNKKAKNATYPKLATFLADLALAGNIAGMGVQAYEYKAEAAKIKKSMAFTRFHITSEQMVVLKDKGTNRSGHKREDYLAKADL